MRIENIFQVETDQLGVILLTWQIPARLKDNGDKGFSETKSDVNESITPQTGIYFMYVLFPWGHLKSCKKSFLHYHFPMKTPENMTNMDERR